MSIFRISVTAFALLLWSHSANSQNCADIRTFNFRDTTIQLAASDDGSLQRAATFALRNGAAFLSDDPHSPNSRDWQVEIVADRLAHLDPSTSARIIVLEKRHLTGTGTWNYVLVFTCDNGSAVRLFQYSAQGVVLKHLEQGALTLYQPAWKQADPQCCPSRHLETVYRWNAKKRRFDRPIPASGSGFKPVPNEK